MKIIINEEDLGESFVVLSDGDVWVKREDFERTRLAAPFTAVTFEGEEYVSLGSIKGLGFAINEEEAGLRITAPPELFERQQVSLAFRRPYEVRYTRENSAFLNYAIIYELTDSVMDLSLEAGLKAGEYLGTSTFNYRRDSESDRFVRLLTTVTRDWRDGLTRLSLGDFTAASGVLGSTLLIGGVGYARNFSIDPYFYHYPSLRMTGVAETPSDVEVYIDGALVKKEKLRPGLFELSDVPANVGLGFAEIVVTDAYGTRRVVREPFFYTDRTLKKGLHEYSYSMGFTREDLGVESFSYGDPALLAFHSYGFTEDLKGGYSAEASDEVLSAGPTATLRLSNAGVVDVATSLSRSHGETGFGAFLGYFFRARRFNTAFSLRGLTRNFSSLSIGPFEDKAAIHLTASAGVSTRALGSFSAEFSTARFFESPDTRRYALLYNRVLTRNANVFLTAARTDVEDGEKIDEVFLGLHIYFGRDVSSTLGYTDRDGEITESASVQKSLPVGEGLGFSLRVDDTEDGTNTSDEVRYQNEYAVYGYAYRKLGEAASHELSLAGGIGYIDRTLFISRPITDSFIMVSVGDLEGVRVYYDGNEAGRTSRDARLVIPSARSYRDNRIDIEEDDIPINYSIPSLTEYVNPPLRSGGSVTFDVARIQGQAGHIYAAVDGEEKAVEFSVMRIILKDRVPEGLVGKDGEFYIENIPPGKHLGTVTFEGRGCLFELAVPETKDEWIDLGKVICRPGAL